MKKSDSIRSKDLHLIRMAGDESNAKTRETLKSKYKRIDREKRSKFWVWFYYWNDRLRHKKKKAIWTGSLLRRKGLENELVEVDMNEGSIKK